MNRVKEKLFCLVYMVNVFYMSRHTFGTLTEAWPRVAHDQSSKI